MEIQLILTAFVVSSGLTYARDNKVDTNIITDEVTNGKDEIQANLRNLFDSISARDMKNAGTYHDILETEAAREHHAFDAVKQEIQSRQWRNARSQQTFSNKARYIGGNATLFKRQTETQQAEARQTETQPAKDPGITALSERYCGKLKAALSKYDAPGVVKALNEVYSHYSEVPWFSPKCKISLMRKFEDCDMELAREVINEPYKDKVDKVQAVGVLDMRSVNWNGVNFAIKAKFVMNVCDLVAPLMRIMESEHFKELYPETEKVMLFLFSYGLNRESVIHKWITFVYQSGDIVDTAYNDEECLQSEKFKEQEVTFNERPVLDYFKFKK